MWPSFAATLLHTIFGNDEATTRTELNSGQIIDERDYVSTLCARIRTSCAQAGLSAHTQNLPNSASQTLGADFILVVHDDYVAKLAILEAKWPRAFSKPGAKWDKAQGGKSHFSSQLTRQKLAPDGAFVGEFFINESPVGTHTSLLDDRGGTIVPHASAQKYDALRPNSGAPWKTHDFWELHGYKRQRITTLRDLVLGLATCSTGKKLPISGGNLALMSLDGKLISNVRLNLINDNHISHDNDRSAGAQLLIVELPQFG